MERGNKHVPEPLSDQRWSRIERRLFERVANGEAEPTAPRSRMTSKSRAPLAAVLVLAGAAAAAVGALGWRALYASPQSQVALIPSRVSTDATGSRVSVGEATLDVAPQSVVSVTGDDQNGVVVSLERGRVECEVPPRGGRPPFWVKAGDVSVRVVGTHFAVARTAAKVDVEVQRGVVLVTAQGQETPVHAGEQWPRPPAPSSASGSDPSAVAPQISPSAQLAPSAQPIASLSPPSPRELYEAATRLEASRPDLAIAKYQALASKGGPWGMNALYAQGRLESERGHATEARRLLEDYLAHYPSGPNAGDAKTLLERQR